MSKTSNSPHSQNRPISHPSISRIRSSFPDEVPVFWLPGDMGLFEEWRPEDEYGPGQYLLSLGDLDGQNKQTIGIYYSPRIAEGALSPDGRYFLFEVGRGDSSDMNNLSFPFLLIDLQRRTWKEISTPNFGDFSWNPESTQFVYIGKISDPERNVYWGGLFLYDLLSNETTLLRERSFGVWSPNGEWMAVYDYSQEEDQLYLMRPDGADPRPIPLPPPWPNRIIHEMHWIPDGSGLYLRAQRQDRPQKQVILYVDLMSMQVTSIFEFTNDASPFWPRMKLSPDAHWFLLESFYQYSIGYLSNWYLCNQQDCSLFSPPGSDHCNKVDWMGPYKR